MSVQRKFWIIFIGLFLGAFALPFLVLLLTVQTFPPIMSGTTILSIPFINAQIDSLPPKLILRGAGIAFWLFIAWIGASIGGAIALIFTFGINKLKSYRIVS